MQPGNRSLKDFCISLGDIQFPSMPLTPSFGVGIVSRLLGVDMNVKDSTRATSAGSVRASQLKGIRVTLQTDKKLHSKKAITVRK